MSTDINVELTEMANGKWMISVDSVGLVIGPVSKRLLLALQTELNITFEEGQ